MCGAWAVSSAQRQADHLQLATPPQIRCRADLYRENMDPKIIEDTAPLHWMLDQKQTIEFLGNLFPDDRLFPSSNAASSLTNGGVTSIVDHMKTIRQRSKDRWAYYPDSPCAEEKIAQFFNGIIQHVPNAHLCTRCVRIDYVRCFAINSIIDDGRERQRIIL